MVNRFRINGVEVTSMEFLEFFGLFVGIIYFGTAMYAETQRHKSSFWFGWSDVTGFRIFGFNLDKTSKTKELPFNDPIRISVQELEDAISKVKKNDQK